MKRSAWWAVAGACVLIWGVAGRAEEDGAGTEAKSVLDFEVQDIDGEPVELSRYKGDVLLMVNVASECGLTPQYEELQALQDKYGERGLRVLGFPANNFGGQEPGTNEQIKQFCRSKFQVTFDMFSKVSVKGSDCCPLYRFLTDKESNGEFGGDIRWNFTKFLIGRDGKVVSRFEPPVKPMSKEVTEAIEKALETES